MKTVENQKLQIEQAKLANGEALNDEVDEVDEEITS